ncbi:MULTISPECIES: MBL fold metallo-hydrolase [unclassified Erythrobacter]|uniref:MBL fold metallo-hydrolase n=1 Tax=unclassified Erythrobacter TaxID=2633097 RepID=UPI00076D5FEF|nr:MULTISPECIES: MBL fold metallo-hydrolase [unclassified Erythrobacter]KWV96031.1 MBL fold metallo-hydrolase [Erythrobacter sp. AP23]MBO6526054.1 MBL fold metallo-hydrolase [Erythrobacter sp.]MBO6531128.1 MBL fold metallo-hydrolase [Erythrobacter sp.]
MKLLMLGSGTSTGVPRIGNDWGECDPREPRNRRSRVSIIVENDTGQKILVDTSTDLRAQLLANGIAKVDAVFWTHDHADHCHGIDDLRVMRYDRSNPLPGFASKVTCERLRRRFDYVFEGQFGYPTVIGLKDITSVQLVAGFSFDHVEMPHGPVTSTGFRFEADGKSIVYATDFSEITPAMVRCFERADILVVDCLRRRPHPTHANLDMALELARKAKVRRTVLTHMDKSMDYRSLCAEVPDHVTVGYDGLEMVA